MKTYEEIVAEVNEVHPCSEKEAAMLYAEQFKPQWIHMDNATKQQKKDFNNIDSERLIVFFDNGEIRRYDEEYPFAMITDYFILPELPKKVEQ